MMKRIRVLFICSKNQWRSPTAEVIYRDDSRVEVRSRGTTRRAMRTITSSDLRWADVVLVMEHKHRQRLVADYPGEAKFTPIHVLDICDDYQFMDEELQALIRTGTEPILEEFRESDSIQSTSDNG